MTHLPGRGSREKDVLVRCRGTARRLPVVLPRSSGGRTAILCGWWSFKKFIIIIFSPHLRTFSHCFWERGRGGERETERQRETEREWDTHWLSASRTLPSWGSNPQHGQVPWPEILPATFHCWDDAPTNWATPTGQGCGSWSLIPDFQEFAPQAQLRKAF